MEQLTQIIQQKSFIIWDFDHTIVNLNIDWIGLKENLVQLDPSIEGKPLFEMMNRLRDTGQTTEAFAIIAQFEANISFTPNQKVINLIKKEAKKNIHLLFTDNLNRTVTRVLKSIDLYDLFTYIVAKDDLTAWKPESLGIQKLMEQTGIQERSQYLLIGDSWKDKQAATSAGIDFINITTV